ncbi:MFS transporter [Streptomyces roseirectus]|uniref:MFS transporter n=1 Tax=Streptomyces roseirectus TaxID=2768066 RepID=A0A7H0IKP9_9ACTN|nr:MFS transporter [Streptomyces roseirectus]QNP73365.1 MFS transporter [Streptomyces roseirectus]
MTGFWVLWGAAVVSRFGDALRGAALPLLAVRLTDDPVVVASVTACGYVPWLLFGLVGGALADRVDQRRAMWVVDVVRGVLVAGFAVAVAGGYASVGLLLGLAFALTTLQTLFDNAATALLPAVVGRGQLGGANARLMTGQQVVGGLVGVPVAAVLVGVGVAVPFAVDAVSYFVAAGLIASLRVRVPARGVRAGGSTLRGEIRDGLRVLWREPVLRAASVANLLCNVGMSALIATLVLHVTRWLDAGDGGYSAVLTAFAVGAIGGGFVAQRVGRWLGRARALMVCGAVQVVALGCMGSVRHLTVSVVAMLVFGVMNMVWNVNEVTLTQERSPEGMLGRISAAGRTAAYVGTPFGALLGGVVASAFGLNVPVLSAAALIGLAVVSLIPAGRVDVRAGAVEEGVVVPG